MIITVERKKISKKEIKEEKQKAEESVKEV